MTDNQENADNIKFGNKVLGDEHTITTAYAYGFWS